MDNIIKILNNTKFPFFTTTEQDLLFASEKYCVPEDEWVDDGHDAGFVKPDNYYDVIQHNNWKINFADGSSLEVPFIELDSYTKTIKCQRFEVTMKLYDEFDPRPDVIKEKKKVVTLKLVGDDIVSIEDANTGDIVFENKYLDKPKVIQRIMLFGVVDTLQKLQTKKSSNKLSEDIKTLLRKQMIEEGEKLIYPQRQQEWQNYVNSEEEFGDDYLKYCTFALIKEIETSDNSNSATDLFYRMLPDLGYLDFNVLYSVAKFSKQGPAFMRKVVFSTPYYVDQITSLTQESPEDIKKAQELTRTIQERLETIEEQNSQFEYELMINKMSD